jgi:hypothetical protein
LLGNHLSPGHWGYAIAVNFSYIVVFTLLEKGMADESRVSLYFEPRAFEKNGNIYRWLGILYFKRLLKRIGWEKVIRGNQSMQNNPDSLKDYRQWTISSELIHRNAGIVVLLFSLLIGYFHGYRHIFWLVVVNILVNGYPVMLQRYNRHRADRLIRLMHRRRQQKQNYASK